MKTDLNFTTMNDMVDRDDAPRIRHLLGVTEDGHYNEGEIFRVQVMSMDAKPVYDKARQVMDFLRECGMQPPQVCKDDLIIDIFYKIMSPPEDFSTVKQDAIKVLDLFFSDSTAEVTDGGAEVDLEGRLFDGSLAGSEITGLDTAAAYFPVTPESPHECNNYDPKAFRMTNFLKIHGLTHTTEKRDDITIYRLQRNPLTGEETGGAALYERMTPGGPCIGYHCIDPGQTGRKWSDIRKKLSPDPEEKAAMTERQRALQPLIAKEIDTSGPLWMDVSEIEEEPEKQTMSTGLPTLDGILRGGFRAGEMTILTGLPASGKSTWLSQLIIHAAETGTKSGIFSGELTASRFKSWMLQQLAGTHCIRTPGGRWTIQEADKKDILEWMKGRIYLYRNDAGMAAERIIQTAETAITSYGLGLLVLDNFMMLDTATRAEDTIQAQTRVATALSAIAKKYNIHVILVAHPRKQQGFLTAYDVAGTSNLYNLSDNLIAVHRINETFTENVKKIYGLSDDDDLFSCDNALQVLKNREAGVQGDFVGLDFKEQSRTLIDSKSPQIMTRCWENKRFFKGGQGK